MTIGYELETLTDRIMQLIYNNKSIEVEPNKDDDLWANIYEAIECAVCLKSSEEK